uniref:Contactin 1b n=1 Tax=Cyprinus carpio TaxID=7962 RepID=A0A8C1Q1M5_CYPCA
MFFTSVYFTTIELLGCFFILNITLAHLMSCSSEEATGFGPIFEEEPLDTVYAEDSPENKISMNCRARANPPAIIKYIFTLLILHFPDEHFSLVGGNLVITNPDKGKHAGKYVCVAKNVYGTVISKEATVKFGYLNQFPTDEREPVHVKEGQGAVLLCSPPSRYPSEVLFRWIYNDFPNFIIPDQRRFVSQTTGNMYIAKVEPSDVGNYSCFVSSPTIGKSVFSMPIPLLPQIEKEVKRYPADIRVKFPKTYALVHQNITLECFALGNPLPHIRWRKLDADLPPNYEVSMNGALLHLINVQYEDEGSYECETLNVKGMDWYRQWLYVEGAPEWAEHINDTEKDVGSELTLRCVAVGKPLPWIRWLKDGYSYGKGELKFSSLTFEDSGMYQCVAENEWGTIYASAELRVVSCAPTFIYNPVKKVLLGAENGRVVIECKPRAAPKPKFIWKRGSELLTNSSRMLIWDDGSLEILNVSKSDEGSYTCYAENDRGKSNSTGTLTITEATKITVAPSDTEAVVGDTTILQCSASFDPSLDITFIWTVDSYGHENRGDLLIKNIQVRHAGHYSCTAQTIVDNATAEADVSVKGLPGPPGGVRVEEIGDTSVKLRWSLGSDHGKYFKRTNIIFPAPVFLDGSTESATVINLYPWMQYEFRVHAINEFGAGENSRPSIKIKTWDARPTVAPSEVIGQVGISGELIVTWTPQFFFGKKFGYIVAFKQHEDYEWKWATVEDPETRRYVYKESMTPDTEIQVKVSTYNNKGEGPSSLISAVYSPRLGEMSPTEAPLDVYARQVTSTEALVWWLPVYQSPPNWVDGYQIRYWRKYDDNEAAASRVIVHRTVNQTRLENMRPDSHYLIEVRAFNGAGLGPPSEHCEMFTRRPRKRFALLYITLIQILHLKREILFRKEGERYGKLYTTGRHYIDFPMPETGDYVIEVRARCEGGDGPISQIRVQGEYCLLLIIHHFPTLIMLMIMKFSIISSMCSLQELKYLSHIHRCSSTDVTGIPADLSYCFVLCLGKASLGPESLSVAAVLLLALGWMNLGL